MCTGAEGLLLAGLLSTAAGTGAQISGARKSRRASEEAAAREFQRKKQLSDEAEAIFNADLVNSGVGKARETADAAAAAGLEDTRELIARQGGGFTSATETAGLENASPVVKETAARSLANELAVAEAQMKARSKLQGVSQRTAQRGRQLQRQKERMAILGSFQRGWGDVGQAEQQSARFAGANRQMLGDLLVGAGSMATMGGAMGGGTSLFGFGPAGAAPLSSAPLSGAALGEVPGGLINPGGYPSLAPGSLYPPDPYALTGKLGYVPVR